MTIEQPFAPSMDDSSEDFAAMFASQEEANEQLHQGQKVNGTIIALTGETVFLDVGLKVDGIMDRKDILDTQGELIANVGDKVEAWVVGVSSHEIRLSRSMSGSGISALEEARDAAIPVEGRISAVCKGGYTVDVMGKRAFCPGSQMEIGSQNDPEAPVGRTLQFLITRIENRGRNIVVSRRSLLDRERKENLVTLLNTLKEGDIVEGPITRLAAFGAFMEIAPAVEGMIHISELAWGRIANAEEVVSVQEIVRAKVLSITQDVKGQTRISLSRRQAAGDPWESAHGKLEVGSIVQGKVVRIVPFGVFVEVLPGVEGLVHISEMSWAKRVRTPEDVVQMNDIVSVKIKEFSVERRRLSLSLRDAEGDPWSLVPEQFRVGTLVNGTVEGSTSHGLFVTLQAGVTGLLPATVLKASGQAKALSALDKGDAVTLMVQSVDLAQRRISLAPEGTELNNNNAATNTPTASAAAPVNSAAPVDTVTPGLGALGQALQIAIQKKK